MENTFWETKAPWGSEILFQCNAKDFHCSSVKYEHFDQEELPE